MTELILPGGDLIYCSTTSTPSPPDIHLVTATFCQHKTKGCLKLVVLLLYWLCPVYVVPMRIFCETYYKLPKLFISLRKKKFGADHPTIDPVQVRTHINQYRFRTQSRRGIRRDTLKQLLTLAQRNPTQTRDIAKSNAASRNSISSWQQQRNGEQLNLRQGTRSTARSLPTHGTDYVMDCRIS